MECSRIAIQERAIMMSQTKWPGETVEPQSNGSSMKQVEPCHHAAHSRLPRRTERCNGKSRIRKGQNPWSLFLLRLYESYLILVDYETRSLLRKSGLIIDKIANMDDMS